MSKKDENSGMESEESLLYSARHGELSVVKALLEARIKGQLMLDINCKGKNKSNLGWTPLHLATYFGHKEVVEVLLDAGANVDEVNESGDTALHKASFIGNEDILILLLSFKADVHVMNGEGRTALDMCKTHDVQRLLEAAELAERRDRERNLLNAAKEGQIEIVQELLSSSNSPNINCVDAQGNTCLHCAAYRGHAHVAVLLLQNGVDTSLRNSRGQLAIDLARDADMREVLSVRPVQRLQRTAARFEGALLKRSRFLGWRPVWAVLQRGVLLYYGGRAEAARAGGKWRDRKYLDGAKAGAPDAEPALLVLSFSDGDTHRLAVPHKDDVAAHRQAWVTALKEHIAYSGHYLWAGAPDVAREATEDADDDCKPLGSMQDALTTATNNLALLDTQLRECNAILTALDKTAHVGNSLHHSAYMRFQHACGSGAAALAALRHCAALVAQQRDRDAAALATQVERNRVLEEALAALARTHHALEMSVAEELSKSKRKKKTMNNSRNESKENFYDVFDESGDEDDTLVTAGLCSPLGALSPWGSSADLARRTPVGSDDDGDVTPTNERALSPDAGSPRSAYSAGSPGSAGSAGSLHTALSRASSRGTLVSAGGHVYRNARPYRKTRLSSHWSL